MQTAETLLAVIRERGTKGLPIERVYRMLYNKELYLRAYAKLYPNQGAMTPGVTPETVDGMSTDKIDSIIEAVKNERYQWKPVKRTYIKKANGKLRPLGLPTWSDKLLQEVIRSILDAYYDPQFSEHSHGFRQSRGCHTALQEMQITWRGTTWFIEGDISQYFDTIDHSRLLEILAEKIHDNRFLNLIQGLLKAGYLEDWKYNHTYSGTPQGGVLSPLLSNIYLDKLDQYVEETLIPMYTKGDRKATNPAYLKTQTLRRAAKQRDDREAHKELTKQMQQLPSQDPNDPNYMRLKYVRYADDFLLGVTGSKALAEEIKLQIGDFLSSNLNLKMSQEKTLITNATQETARFLGYEVHCMHDDTKHTGGKRSINGLIGLRVPRNITEKRGAKYMRKGKPIHLSYHLESSDYSIVTEYQMGLRGLVQYYALAYNVSSLSHLKYIVQESLIKTLANKHRISKKKAYAKYSGTAISEDGKVLKCLRVEVEREGKKPLVATFGGFSIKRKPAARIDDQVPKPINTRTEILQRLMADACEICGSSGNVEVHHIRRLSDLKKRGSDPNTGWKALMAKRRRKTLVVCKACHTAIHNGKPTKTREELLESRILGNL
jgi:group II intron reverse transcriptase/maturase